MESVITKRELPKDLASIPGLRTGFHPPGAQQMRLTITGQPGSGKSTLLNSNPCLMMLDPEHGGDTVADPRAMRFTPPPKTPLDQLDKAYMDFVDRIIQRFLKGKTDIRMFGIDTLDELVLIFQKAECLRANVSDIGDVGGGHGKGYFLVRDAIFGMLDKIHRAGMGWAIIAHTKIRYVTVGNTEKALCCLAVSDSYKSAVFQKCEHMMFLENSFERVVGPKAIVDVGGRKVTKPGKVENVKVRKLKTSPGGLWKGGSTDDVKVRVPFEDEMIIPKLGGWDTIVSAYDCAVVSLKEGEKV